MFARHLMFSTILSSAPTWQISDTGLYTAATRYDLDRANRIYYRATATDPTFIGTGTVVGSDGQVLITNRPTGASANRISLYATDKAGPVGAALASYAVPAGSLWNLYGRSATTFVSSGSEFTANLSYALTHVDLATGTRYPMGSVGTVSQPGVTGFNYGDGFCVLTGSYRGTYLGYKQTTGAAWANVLQASGSRARRATIPRQVYDEKGIAAFWRMRPAATPELVHLLPWRRPLTTDTRVRAYGMVLAEIGTARVVSRRNRAYTPATLTVHEIEIGPSTGATTLNGQPMSRHSLTVHLSRVSGFVVVDKEGATMIVTGRGDDDTVTPVLQYLAADGTPTGEFVTAASGDWSYVPVTPRILGAAPHMVTMNNLLTLAIDPSNGVASSTAFNVLDITGTFVRTGTFPPGGAGSYGMILMPSADMLMTSIEWYKTGPASYDLGTTWFTITGWGPRGSIPPTAPRGDTPPENTDLLGSSPLFPT